MYQDSVTQLTKQIKSKDSEVFQLQSTINNQQRVLQSLQEEVQRNQDDYKAKVRKLDLQISQSQMQILEANQAVVRTQTLEQQVTQMKIEKDSLSEQLSVSRQLLEELKEECDRLIRKVAEEQASREFLIDRRLINTFLVQYSNPKSNHATKMKMLDALSKMLLFSDQEKLELGLIQPERQKMGDSLMNFLLGDSDL